jgi:hypothetical protein
VRRPERRSGVLDQLNSPEGAIGPAGSARGTSPVVEARAEELTHGSATMTGSIPLPARVRKPWSGPRSCQGFRLVGSVGGTSPRWIGRPAPSPHRSPHPTSAVAVRPMRVVASVPVSFAGVRRDHTGARAAADPAQRLTADTNGRRDNRQRRACAGVDSGGRPTCPADAQAQRSTARTVHTRGAGPPTACGGG